jgi:hypothetical protein
MKAKANIARNILESGLILNFEFCFIYKAKLITILILLFKSLTLLIIRFIRGKHFSHKIDTGKIFSYHCLR